MRYNNHIYENLLDLPRFQEKDTYYHKDEILDGVSYRIFGYRLLGYFTSLNSQASIWSRGMMFDMSDTSKPICTSLYKFYNLHELPTDKEELLAKVIRIEEKMDGSLISTFMHNGALRFKTKGTLFSSQASDAMTLLNEDEALKSILTEITSLDYTVNLEYVAPSNRVVLHYEKPQLTVLNVFNTHDGNELSRDHLLSFYPALVPYMVKTIPPFLWQRSIHEYIQQVYSDKGVEGVILVLNDGQRVKIKTSWYMDIHKTQENILNDKHLVSMVINEQLDDARFLFKDREDMLKRIESFQNSVSKKYNEIAATVSDYHARNKDLIRKDYAIGAKSILGDKMGLAMSLYDGRDMLKEYSLKHPEIYLHGIS